MDFQGLNVTKMAFPENTNGLIQRTIIDAMEYLKTFYWMCLPPPYILQREFSLVTGDCIQFSGPETRRLVSDGTYLEERNRVGEELEELLEVVEWENRKEFYGGEGWKYRRGRCTVRAGRLLGMRGTGRERV